MDIRWRDAVQNKSYESFRVQISRYESMRLTDSSYSNRPIKQAEFDTAHAYADVDRDASWKHRGR